MRSRSIDRRHVLAALVASGVVPLHRLLADDSLLPATPSATEGPFYPAEIPSDSDNDLLNVVGRDAVPDGQAAYVHGKVVDRNGTPIDGTRVEIWQCDNSGVYHHPRDRGTADENFQGFGAMVTDRKGNYHFRTLRPVPYGGRTPHIHFRVTAPSFDRLSTQLYVAEEAARNKRDGLYNRHSQVEQLLVTSSFRQNGAGLAAAEFNIVLG